MSKGKGIRNWSVRGIDHVGIAVKNLDQVIPTLRDKFGLSPSKLVDVSKDQGLKMALVEMRDGSCFIELMQPTDPSGTVAKFLSKAGRSSAIHHIAFAVDKNLEDVSKDLAKLGVEMVYPKPRLGVKGHPVNFCHPRTTSDILIEICDVDFKQS
jgi:methylmalonyl-CoA/ethylmalonyl-CoA epimerase